MISRAKGLPVIRPSFPASDGGRISRNSNISFWRPQLQTPRNPLHVALHIREIRKQ